jgi:predicted PurR-regulated permease PerM
MLERPGQIVARPERVPARQETTRTQRVARGALALGLLVLGAWTVRTFLPALVWAAILAIATWPSYQRAQRRWPPGKHNILLPACFTLGIALIVLVPLGLAGVQFGREAHGLFLLLEEATRTGVAVPEWIPRLPLGGQQITSWWNQNLADPAAAKELVSRLGHGEMVSVSRDVGSKIAHRIVLFGFTLLTLFFLFRDGSHLSHQMLRASYRAFGGRGERIGHQIIASVHGTVDGLVLVGVGVGLLLGVAYWIAGVPHPTLLGGLTVIAAMIPFGAPLVFGAASLVVLAQGSAPAAIALFLFGTALVFITDHFVRPALIGGSTRLPFIWVLLGILGGVETWGLLGLFLGPAIMAALMLLWREYTEGPADPDGDRNRRRSV